MSKTLIIAEKPSVATDIQKALGGMSRVKSDAGDYFEGEQYVVASAVGHLLELAVPEKYDVKRGKWTFAHLPLIPPEFTLKPIVKSKAEAAREADSQEGHRLSYQCLRCRTRRGTDLSIHRSSDQGQAADQAPVAAVDDSGVHPERL